MRKAGSFFITMAGDLAAEERLWTSPLEFLAISDIQNIGSHETPKM